MKLDDLCDFQVMDFTKISFPDNSFDRAYAIEATCHATDLADVYKEIFRVLKPGTCVCARKERGEVREKKISRTKTRE